MEFKKRKKGDIIHFNCPDCEGKGYILIKPIQDLDDEEKIKENSKDCETCKATGKIEGVVR
jgi:hypothetical protein